MRLIETSISAECIKVCKFVTTDNYTLGPSNCTSKLFLLLYLKRFKFLDSLLKEIHNEYKYYLLLSLLKYFHIALFEIWKSSL